MEWGEGGPRQRERRRPGLRAVLPLCFALGALATSGCNGLEPLGSVGRNSCDFSPYDETTRRLKLELATFWVNSAENEAFKVLTSKVDPEVCTVSETPRNDRVAQQRSLQDWVAEGEPMPDAFQVNGGSDLLQWASGKDPDESELCPLDPLSDRFGWREAFFPAALEPVSCGGHLFGLPVGIHRLNTLLVNRRAFTELDARAKEENLELVPLSNLDSLAAFLAELDAIAELDARLPVADRIVPLALGATTTWPITIVAFENFLASLSVEAYETLWRGRLGQPGALSEEELRKILAELFVALERAVSRSNAEKAVRWQDAIKQVASGEALFTIMGDWSWAQLEPSERNDVIEIRFPGTESAYLYTPDSFAIPRIEGHDGAAPHLWLREIIGNKETQIEFSAKKNSIPAMRGLTEGELAALPTETLRESYRSFSSCQSESSKCHLLLAVSGLGPAPTKNPCFDRIGAWLARSSGYTASDPNFADTPLGPCEFPEPKSVEEAREFLVETLIDVAKGAFAKDCR